MEGEISFVGMLGLRLPSSICLDFNSESLADPLFSAAAG
jgi:hypothetical protein